MKFEIGDKVKVYGLANEHHNRVGEVTDVLQSRRGGVLCEVQFEGEYEPCDTFFDEDSLEKIVVADPTISFKVYIADNVVIAIMLQGERQIARGHGHIIHDGAVGVAQAASYSMKKAYEFLNGGSMIGGEYHG